WTGYSGDYATYEITHGTTVNHAKFKKTSGGKIWEQNYTYSAGTEGEWKMAMGARETVSDKTTTTITKSVNADSMMIITYQDFAWGKGMTARKAVVPGSPTTVLWQETFSYNSSGKLQTYTSPTGQIITYTW